MPGGGMGPAAERSGFAVFFGQADPRALLEQRATYYAVEGKVTAVAMVAGTLAVATEQESWLARMTPARELERLATPLPIGHLGVGVDSLTAADVDGDGLEDLILGGVIPSVLLHEECGPRVMGKSCSREGP
jgi:hypothetical protein